MKFAVIDFETTGSQPTDEIIQIGLVITDETQVIERYTALVKPGVSIPSYISGLTSITDEMVQGAPSLEEILPILMPKLQDCILVAHNADFDLKFLQSALDHHGYLPFDGKVLDTMDLLRILYPRLGSMQLSMVSYTFGIEHDRPHQADSDAEATAQIWLRCLQRWNELPLITAQRLSQLFDSQESDFGWFLQQLRIRRELYSPIDSESHRYYRQFALNVEDWGDEPELRKQEDTQAFKGVPFSDFFADVKQSLETTFDSYEERPAQEQMIQEIEQSFSKERHLLIEAGTGTGKSIGYLIPSLYYGIREGKKVIVSTHTINLQEQLRDRDIPLLNEIIPVPFRASVLKGRSHYLCLRKFEHKMNTRDFVYPKEDHLTAAQMTVWLSETTRGDDEELHFSGRGHEFWRTVASDTDSCLNRACPWFKKCFYHRARHEANIADVVITNHSMLFTDTKADNRLLPAYDHLVIDEAHHLEEVASRHFGFEVNYGSFVSTLLWLYKDSKSGLLPLLQFRLQNHDHEKIEEWNRIINEMFPKIMQIKEEWDTFCELMYGFLAKQDPSQAETGQIVMRVKAAELPNQWDKIKLMEENLFLTMGDVLKPLESLSDELKVEQEELGIQAIVTDLGGVMSHLNEARQNLRFFVSMNNEEYVYWVEANGYYKSKSLYIYSVPVDVSPLLQQYFFSNKKSIVMTSATLSVDKSFDYTCEQLGLDSKTDDHLKTVLLPSPFNYRKQALVCIPRDFPSVKGSQGDPFFIDRLISSLRDVAIETKGRMLVLFTSYRMLKQVYPGLKEQLSVSGIQVFGQGMDSGNRSKLTRLFQENQASVLLGTSSFWEGVDIPGEALSCLAIVRLPFQPPSHPILEAKTELIQKKQQNPFIKLSVPQAVIRFKQGFGRLVRTTKDRGVVIIYDTRVIDSYYGKYFLYSLPGPKIEHMNTSGLVPRIKEWMESGNDEN